MSAPGESFALQRGAVDPIVAAELPSLRLNWLALTMPSGPTLRRSALRGGTAAAVAV